MKLDRFLQFVEKMNEASTAAATAAITMRKNLNDLTNQRHKKDDHNRIHNQISSTSTPVENDGDAEMEAQDGDEEMEAQDDVEMEAQDGDEEMSSGRDTASNINLLRWAGTRRN